MTKFNGSIVIKVMSDFWNKKIGKQNLGRKTGDNKKLEAD